jgi:hypothetical protein
MEILMKPKIMRFSQTEPGDLFIYEHSNGTSVALTVWCPIHDEKLAVVIGPNLPDDKQWQTLIIGPESHVISFDKNFCIRLPSRPRGWRTSEPPPNVHCFLVMASGEIFLRADYRTGSQLTSGTPNRFMPCYISLDTGKIASNPQNRDYIAPTGYRAFAIEWEIISNETLPRTILSFPFEQSR